MNAHHYTALSAGCENKNPDGKLASVSLWDAWTDFYVSRQGMDRTPATLDFYRQTGGAFLRWIESQGVTDPKR